VIRHLKLSLLLQLEKFDNSLVALDDDGPLIDGGVPTGIALTKDLLGTPSL